jgi:hypothetical protein
MAASWSLFLLDLLSFLVYLDLCLVNKKKIHIYTPLLKFMPKSLTKALQHTYQKSLNRLYFCVLDKVSNHIDYNTNKIGRLLQYNILSVSAYPFSCQLIMQSVDDTNVGYSLLHNKSHIFDVLRYMHASIQINAWALYILQVLRVFSDFVDHYLWNLCRFNPVCIQAYCRHRHFWIFNSPRNCQKRES